MAKDKKLEEFLELINHYPSPHNGQPMMIQSHGNNRFDALFDTGRGLKSTPISHLFSFVTIGVFLRHLEKCAEALGHRVSINIMLPRQSKMAGPTPLKCAEISINFDVSQPNDTLKNTIRSRQTSRKKYSSGLDQSEKLSAQNIARQHGLRSEFVSNDQAQKIIWLNQRAVFDDMFDDDVRRELDHWLRYSTQEKHAKKDGLSYDCMELNGWVLHFFVNHYKLLHYPVVAPLLKQYYLRTMRDSSSVGYITSPFETEEQAYQIGRAIIDIWLELTRHGHYLHPFGTIVSNTQAHRDFTELIGLNNESRTNQYVVFIFRAGKSAPPVLSDRLPIDRHLYKEIL